MLKKITIIAALFTFSLAISSPLLAGDTGQGIDIGNALIDGSSSDVGNPLISGGTSGESGWVSGGYFPVNGPGLAVKIDR